MTLRFTVVGIPAPKGSSKAFAFRRGDGSLGAAVTHDNKRTKPWQATVGVTAAIAKTAAGIAAIWTGPVRLDLVFYMPKPQKPKHAQHITKPDLDKLIRAVKDGLTGVVWQDDSQVIEVHALKAYCARTSAPGAAVCVSALEEMF